MEGSVNAAVLPDGIPMYLIFAGLFQRSGKPGRLSYELGATDVQCCGLFLQHGQGQGDGEQRYRQRADPYDDANARSPGGDAGQQRCGK